MSPRQQAENTLKEAFPSIDAAVVRAVLTASGGHVEPAFNALLGPSNLLLMYQNKSMLNVTRHVRSRLSTGTATTSSAS